jgi:NADPH-dependent 2,4-dienoyl-CoA reductase/sulfur reductase-like enzyme
MQRQWDVLVVGAGPAGMLAAATAAENGLEVILLDEQDRPGGQIYRSVGASGSDRHFLEPEDRRAGLQTVERFLKSGAEYSPGATVWFAEPGRVICSIGGESREIRTNIMVVATGAMERPVPFDGWTLPGVMGAGAADILYKNAGVLPQGPVVLAGNGPLIPLVGAHLASLGVEIAGVLDSSPGSNRFAALAKLPPALTDLPFLMKGLHLLNKLKKSGAPFPRGVRSLRACGQNRLEQVSFHSSGREHTLDAATLLFHEGVIPRTHMSRMLQLEHAWDKVQRYWYPVCDGNGRSSHEKIYVVGDGSFVHGARASAVKGELAGLDALLKLKVISAGEALARGAAARSALRKALAPRKFVDAYFAPRPDLYDIGDQVMVCRCEGVTAGDIRAAAREGCQDLNDLKLRTRCGMGPCQGRMCGPAMAEIAAKTLNGKVPDLTALRVRPPIRPVLLQEMCGLPGEE